MRRGQRKRRGRRGILFPAVVMMTLKEIVRTARGSQAGPSLLSEELKFVYRA